MTQRLDPKHQPWMTHEATRAVMKALTQDGGHARFVGGAVRNALIGEPVSDIDIATPLMPDEIVRRLETSGLSAVPTGIAHGTITAVAMGKPFEITTLRRDVSTDGRRATVAYTDDWAEDAARRDFTMNALYAAQDGTLFDPTGGVADLEAGRVRFVGDARTRIREDYLRILRLFRFHAWYGKGELDNAALSAASAEKSGLQRLSGERVQKELVRLLAARDPLPVLRQMQANGILAELLPGEINLPRLEGLARVSEAREPILALAALLRGPDDAREVASRLRFSNADRQRLIAATEREDVDASLGVEAARRLAYRRGDCFRDRMRLRWAEHPDDPRWRTLLAALQAWTKPVFPLDGKDAMAAGVEEGPAVGRVLSARENWWIEQDFVPDRPALLLKMKELLAQPDA